MISTAVSDSMLALADRSFRDATGLPRWGERDMAATAQQSISHRDEFQPASQAGRATATRVA
jgi:hypothetical protein